NYFDTLTFKIEDTKSLRERALKAETNLRYIADDLVGVSIDETTSLADIQALAALILPEATFDWDKLTKAAQLSIADAHLRADEVLTHEVFNSYHSETEMMRYIKRLEKRDLSLTHSMIPLGSCTMKLNAAVELQPLSYEGFNGLHPFIPDNQAQGYHEMIEELREMLCKITGFAGMSFMPNSGAQGEYAGLMVIREYLRQKGEGHRNVALIPSSAHGTNPASAVMAGMKVVVVKCDENGNIDVDDLTAKAEKHSEHLAALMVTYPSTHGVFEEAIKDINALIHKHGGQVYMDGANLNAQVGLTTPGFLGADVCHLNLHKTFCIPHGGGGPGMGPIGVAAHLVPHLPGHSMRGSDGEKAMGAIAAAPFSSASILTISYAYIKMMGGEALTEATRFAILNANYIRKRLEGHYHVLFTGQNGFVAHELILDLREFKQSAGIEVDDVAKRLIDYGFHAPTVSWPVAGTVMIEPTESESKYELDRFCDALIGIRAEIQEIMDGKADAENNVLKNAPHTIGRLMTDDYQLPYSREKAANPQPQYAQNKFWPHVARVDNSYGDRNLMCTCPPLEAYTDEQLTPA
ncbi:MAG: aminomethyl-transferring glycine dehydrogenase, partial [Bacteroidota bacterium]